MAHPVNPAKAAENGATKLGKTQELVVQFEGAEASAALAKAAAWLGTLAKTRSFSLEQRYVSLDLIDTSTRQHQQQIVEDYVSLAHTRRTQEKLLWEAAHGFWAILSAAYLDAMAAVQHDAAGGASIKDKLPILVARGVRAVGMQIKWIAFRHELVEPWVWSNLARCVRFAEVRDIADSVLPLYRSDAKRVSPNQAFLRALMLTASDTEGLTPLEQEIAGRWIDHWSERFKLDRRASDAVTLYFDLDHALPPRRIIGTPTKAAYRRYFGAAEALPRLQGQLELMRETGASALPISLPKGGELKQVVKVLTHLALHWEKPVPTRAFERRQTTTCMEVKHDYDDVRQVLEQAAHGATPAVQPARAENWIVENAGRGGYSAIVPKGQRPWLHLGVLIAIRLEYQNFWSLALIRRVETDEHHQRKVGIRVIARKPVAALLRSHVGKRTREERGILLNTKPSSNGGVHVLMRPNAFTLEEEIDAHYGADYAQSFTLTPTNVVESAPDYAWVRYEVKP